MLGNHGGNGDHGGGDNGDIESADDGDYGRCQVMMLLFKLVMMIYT